MRLGGGGGTLTETDVRPIRIDEAYREHHEDALHLAYLLTGDRARAEDLVHDAFVKLSRNLRGLRDPRAFPSYLRRTLVNLANSFFRRRRLERAYLEREGRAPETFHPEHDPTTRDALWRALQALPAKQRAAIVLRFYEDLSEEETARVLGCPRGTVKSLVSRGLEVLRRSV